MKALVLAAGEGTRLRPLTTNTPKPLLLVAGRPFMSHVLEALSALDVKDIYILVGWKANKIKEYYGDGSRLGLRIKYLEQRERMGTAHAIGCADGSIDEPFVCINGDVIVFQDDIKSMIEKHASTGAHVMGTVAVEHPERFGVIEAKDDRLVRIHEKPKVPPTKMINAGAFVFNPDIFAAIKATPKSVRGEYEITDTLNTLAESDCVHIEELKHGWMDVGLPWDLLRANEILMARIRGRVEGTVEPGVVLQGEVVVEQGARIRSGAYIEGPTYISEGCDIGPNCYIRSSTCLGPGVKVGASVEVKNSIIMSKTHVPHHNYVGDSILGERCNLGAGTKVANLRFDDKPVKVTFKGQLIDSGRRKLGVIMGDDVKTGINAMIDPGTIVFENSIIGPGAIARGNVGPGSKIL